MSSCGQGEGHQAVSPMPFLSLLSRTSRAWSSHGRARLQWRTRERNAFEVTRRTVIETGTSALLLTTLPRAAVAAGSNEPPPPPVSVELQINGRPHSLTLDPRTTLLDALREHLALTGSKKGCDHGQCGACTVSDRGTPHQLLPGTRRDARRPIRHHGRGARPRRELHPLQTAFVEHDGFQCGYCTSGQICSAIGMLAESQSACRVT